MLFTQGRAAEAAFCNKMLDEKTVIMSNKTFSTTQYHQNLNGAKIVSVHSEESEDFSSFYLFKGNVDLIKLERELYSAEGNALIWIELCSNYIGGHGLSYENLKKIKDLSLKFNVSLVMDATRILENAILIKKYEMPEISINSIVKKITSCADYLVMSLKKDFLCSSGGLISCRNKEDYLVLSDYQITHGGEISGYEKSLISIGLEVVSLS
ncbi:hypothetical protein IW492_17585 [Enterococcus sp. BWB1-3]|nr:hypothetical protein [Enterococcus sp. BWB1-3]